MGDAGFGAEGFVVEDGGAGGFAAGAGGGGDRDKGFYGTGDGLAFADGLVDVIEEVGGVAGVEIGDFRGVDGGAAADGDEGVAGILVGEGDGFVHGEVGRLDTDAVEEAVGTVVVFERFEGGDYGREVAEVGVEVDEDGFGAEIGEVGSDFAGGSGTEADGRGGHFKCVFFEHGRLS